MRMQQFCFSLVRLVSTHFPLHSVTIPPPLRKLVSLAIFSIVLVSCGGGGTVTEADFGVVPPAPGTVVAGGGGTVTEVLSIGNGTGDAFVESILAASQTDLAAGQSTTIRVNVVNQNNAPPHRCHYY